MRLLPHGAKIGNATVIVDIIPKTNPKIRPARKMNPTYITDHDTGNAGRGADAEMHNRYIHNMASYNPKDTSHISWHITVDERFIYQHIPFDENAWHCGDGSGSKSGNMTSIGVEKTMNVDGDREKVEDNAVALHVYLLKNVIKKSPANVVPHQHWSGKFCPAVILRRDGSFVPYRKRIEDAYNGNAKPVSPAATMHTVKRGDTLSAIASKYGSSVAKLQSVNNIRNANFIYPGQVLRVDGAKAVTPSKPKATPKKTSPKLVVDGSWGAATTRELQRALGTPVDGVISGQYRNNTTRSIYSVKFGAPYTGSLLIKSLQRKVGAKVDGYIGPDTVRRLQRHLGTPVDGVISKGSLMVKELQRRLNNGTF